MNKPSSSIPQKFGVCWGDSKDWATERENAARIMNEVSPEYACNPLAHEVRNIASRLDNVASHLEEKDKFVSVIICTQGVPSNEDGEKGPAVLTDYLKSLIGLASLPVKIVFRICSDDDGVLDFYNIVDQKVQSDVLDDYYGEVCIICTIQLL